VVCFFLTDSIYVRKFFSRKNKKIIRVFILLVVLFYGIGVAAELLPEKSPVRTLVEKFKNIPEEVTWSSKKNLEASRTEIQQNWRGYESYQGWIKFNDGSKLQKVMGYGFGARVDLGLIMKLAGEDYETVPILHNEYVMLLVKCGIAGLILYVIFLYKLGFDKPVVRHYYTEPEIYYSYQMLSALGILSLLNTYIGFGLLDQTNQAIPIFLGFFFGIVQRHRFQIKEINQDYQATELTLTEDKKEK